MDKTRRSRTLRRLVYRKVWFQQAPNFSNAEWGGVGWLAARGSGVRGWPLFFFWWPLFFLFFCFVYFLFIFCFFSRKKTKKKQKKTKNKQKKNKKKTLSRNSDSLPTPKKHPPETSTDCPSKNSGVGRPGQTDSILAVSCNRHSLSIVFLVVFFCFVFFSSCFFVLFLFSACFFVLFLFSACFLILFFILFLFCFFIFSWISNT